MSDETTLTPEAAAEAKQAFMADPAKVEAYTTRHHLGHKAAVAEMSRYHEAMHGADPGPAKAPAPPPVEQYDDSGDMLVTMPVPDSPAGYKFPQPPVGVERDPELEQEMREKFHAAEIPQATASMLAMMWNAAAKNPPSEDMQDAAAEKTLASLEKEWGDQTDANIALRNRLIRDVMGERGMELMTRAGLHTHTIFNREMVRIAKQRYG